MKLCNGYGTVEVTPSEKPDSIFMVCMRKPEEHQIFGWLISQTEENGKSDPGLEDAIYGFIEGLHSGQENQPIVIIESLVLAEDKEKAIGIKGKPVLDRRIFHDVPLWLGFRVEDNEIWELLQEYDLFTLEVKLCKKL